MVNEVTVSVTYSSGTEVDAAASGFSKVDDNYAGSRNRRETQGLRVDKHLDDTFAFRFRIIHWVKT